MRGSESVPHVTFGIHEQGPRAAGTDVETKPHAVAPLNHELVDFARAGCSWNGRYAAPIKPARLPRVAFSIFVSVFTNENERLRTCSNMAGAKTSQAGSIPPLSRKSGKLKILTRFASAMPSARPMLSKTALARSLPATAIWYTSSAVRP